MLSHGIYYTLSRMQDFGILMYPLVLLYATVQVLYELKRFPKMCFCTFVLLATTFFSSLFSV